MDKFIAIDLGTTLIKCVLFDETGKNLATESTRCPLEYPKQGYVEQDAHAWYEGVCETISRLVKHCDPVDVKGISISSQGISVVPVDEGMQPLMNAIIWLDGRAGEECRMLAENPATQNWYSLTGKRVSAGWSLALILWIKRNRPEIFEKAYKFLLPMDYVNARMTGNPVTDHTMAAGTMAFLVKDRDWSDEILQVAGLDRERMSNVLPAGALVGTLNEETVKLTGLRPETKVFNGGQDQKIAAYAAGINEELVSLSLGTSGAMEIYVKNPEVQTVFPFFPHIIPGKIVVETCVSTTGAAIQWLKDQVCPDIGFDELNRLAAAAPVGSNGVLFYPHLSGPSSPHVGRKEFGSIKEISLGTTRGDLIRSLYEGLAYEFRLNLEYAKKIGSKVRELILFGGVSKSAVFCQILADVTGMTLYAAENGELGAVGAAKLAVKGVGLDENAFAEAAMGGKKKFVPNLEKAELYNALYSEYIKHYENQ